MSLKQLFPMAAMAVVACQSPEARSIALLGNKQHPSPEVRNVSETQSGLICGGVRWINLMGGYSSWWPFHIKDGRPEIGENYTEIWDPDFSTETKFDRDHRPCKANNGGLRQAS